MSIGKTAAQCAHASQMLTLLFVKKDRERSVNMGFLGKINQDNGVYEVDNVTMQRINIMEEWLNSSFRKVVLRADDKEWEKVKGSFLEGITRVTVIDAGLTEIAAGSETVIGLWPMRKSEVPKVIKKLQVLK